MLQAVRDSGVPAVGHNMALDLAFTLQAFAGPLPPSWREYKALAAAWFPGGIYDTKRLATQLPKVGPPFQNSCIAVGHAIHLA